MGQLVAAYHWCIHGQVPLNDSDRVTMENQRQEANKLATAISTKEQERASLQQEIMRLSDSDGQPLLGNESTWKLKMIDYMIVDDAAKRLISDYRIWARMASNSEHVQLVRGNEELYQRTKDLQEKFKQVIAKNEDLPDLHSQVDSQLTEHKKTLDVAESADLTFKSLMDPGDANQFSETVKRWKKSSETQSASSSSVSLAHSFEPPPPPSMPTESHVASSASSSSVSSSLPLTKKKKKLKFEGVQNSSAL